MAAHHVPAGAATVALLAVVTGAVLPVAEAASAVPHAAAASAVRPVALRAASGLHLLVPLHPAATTVAARRRKKRRNAAPTPRRNHAAVHAGVASTYAHTTAPLRRLVDRYVGEVCVAISMDADVPEWVRAALPGLPETMELSNRRAQQYEGGIVSAVEAAILEPSIGETFDAVVVEVDERDHAGTVQLREPAVTARCKGDLPLGETVEVRLETADVMKRLVRFERT